MAYTRPDYNAADATWVGEEEYTSPAYNAADADFSQQGQIEVGTTHYALSAPTPILPVQPETVSLSQTPFAPLLVVPVWPESFSLSLTPQTPILPLQPETVSLGLTVPVPILPLQPDGIALGLSAFLPALDVIQPPGVSYALAPIDPQTWVVHVPLSIEFRQAPKVPWVMPMTSPVYPPAASVSLSPQVPAVSIRGLWAPPDMIFGWNYDSGTDTISMPLSSLFELTAGQADPATGDWRAIVLALCNTMWDAYIELDDPPDAIQLSYAPGYVMQNGALAGTVKTEYTAVTYLNFPEKTLADEP